jgi:hypothetical protein
MVDDDYTNKEDAVVDEVIKFSNQDKDNNDNEVDNRGNHNNDDGDD